MGTHLVCPCPWNYSMRSITALIFAFIFAISSSFNVHAQAGESIWLSAGNTSYKTNETVLVTVNASSVTPIQGFTFQIRYDPACLKPVNATSPINGMNGLSLPQTAGLVDASFASTTPQLANGILAEVRFLTLGGCQTSLQLESAALAVRNEKGFAAPLPLDPTAGSSPTSSPPIWGIALLTILLIGGFGFGIYKVIQKTTHMTQTPDTPLVDNGSVVVSFKRGSKAGKRFSLNRLPCLIGRDPNSDICLEDPHVIRQHAKIYNSNNNYYLMDMGGETFVNGQAVRRSSAALKSGDVVRLGKSVLFVFGT